MLKESRINHVRNKNKVILKYLSILGMDTLSNAVDLLVHFSAVMVALLTSPSNCKLDTARMPGTNTSNLTETLVSLARQLLGMPSGSHTCGIAKLEKHVYNVSLKQSICRTFRRKATILSALNI